MQVVTSLQMTSSNKPDFNRLACCHLINETEKSVQLVENFQQAGKQLATSLWRLCLGNPTQF